MMVNNGAEAEKARVLIVEDDEALSRLLEEEISDAGPTVRTAPAAEEAERILDEWPADLVISDIRLPGADGVALLHHVLGRTAPPAFIVITAFGSVRQAVDCLQAGADDFLTKPLDLDHLRLSARRALETRRLRRDVRRFRGLLEREDFHGMIGRSRPMRTVFQQVRRVAKGDGPVLIVGESGVGKELVARAVHRESERADGPFLPVNCAGIPQELLESEFFGHAEGAFTGATSARKGLFQDADGGTLMLDEIGEMPKDLQAKLLRVIQDGRVRPVGSSRERRVDVRVLAATNRDLDAAMQDGRFREDLFYRLETFMLRVPPLRERGDDLDLLAGWFVQRVAARLDKDVDGLSTAALDRLRAYPFPGNVRELRNALERAVTFCDGRTIAVEHLPERIRAAGSPAAGLALDDAGRRLLRDGELPPLAELERRYITRVLDCTDGNKRRAAEILGISRRTLYRRLEAAGVDD